MKTPRDRSLWRLQLKQLFRRDYFRLMNINPHVQGLSTSASMPSSTCLVFNKKLQGVQAWAAQTRHTSEKGPFS